MSWLQVSVCWWSQVGAKTHIPVMLVNFVWSCELIIPSSSVLRFYDHKLLSFLSLSFCLSPSFCPPPACSTWLSIQTPDSRSRPQAEEKPDPLSSWRFVFSHSNFPFQSYRPGHPNPSSLFWSCWVIQWPSTISGPYYYFSSHLSTSFTLTATAPPMGKVKFCPLSRASRVFHCEPPAMIGMQTSELNGQTFPYVPDLPARRQRVGFLSPP